MKASMSNSPKVLIGSEPLFLEAAKIREDIVTALYATGGGHYGGCLSVTDILLTLFRRHLKLCPEEPNHQGRDRFILSKGHAALALYAVLRRLGFFTYDLSAYASFLSPLEGHPEAASVPGVDVSTGSLGQGLSFGVGLAYGLRMTKQKVWVVLGDGECQEGQVWEAALTAGIWNLSNIIAVIDYNKYQEWGWPMQAEQDDLEPVPFLTTKWVAFGWRVIECDGHDFNSLDEAFTKAVGGSTKPTIVIAHTVKGKGVSRFESVPAESHCLTVTDDEHRQILKELSIDEAR